MAERGGQEGNQNASKGRMFEGALKRALARDSGSLNRLADKLIQQAEEGQSWAMQMIADRLDGKPKQAIVGGDPEDNPISLLTRIQRTVVDPKA